jgi:hypothetical protein
MRRAGGLHVDVQLVLTTAADEEQADDFLLREQDARVVVLEAFPVGSVPVGLELLERDQAVGGGEGEELLRILAADAGDPPLRGDAVPQAFIDAQVTDFGGSGHREMAVSEEDPVAVGGERVEQRMGLRQREVGEQRGGLLLPGQRFELAEDGLQIFTPGGAGAGEEKAQRCGLAVRAGNPPPRDD